MDEDQQALEEVRAEHSKRRSARGATFAFLNDANIYIGDFPIKAKPGGYLHAAAVSHITQLTGLTHVGARITLEEWIDQQQ